MWIITLNLLKKKNFFKSHQRRLLAISCRSLFSNNLLTSLEGRGLIADTTNRKELTEQLGGCTGVYCGYDPTAVTLHVGNLVTIMTLARFHLAGHRVIAVVGGATAQIGDPSGRLTERQQINETTIETNTRGIHETLARILHGAETYASFNEVMLQTPLKRNIIPIFNNIDWYSGVSVIHFLKKIGVHFRLSHMLAKDSVKSRLGSEEGISFTEFSYQMFQVRVKLDFLNFYYLPKINTAMCIIISIIIIII